MKCGFLKVANRWRAWPGRFLNCRKAIDHVIAAPVHFLLAEAGNPGFGCAARNTDADTSRARPCVCRLGRARSNERVKSMMRGQKSINREPLRKLRHVGMMDKSGAAGLQYATEFTQIRLDHVGINMHE